MHVIVLATVNSITQIAHAVLLHNINLSCQLVGMPCNHPYIACKSGTTAAIIPISIIFGIGGHIGQRMRWNLDAAYLLNAQILIINQMSIHGYSSGVKRLEVNVKIKIAGDNRGCVVIFYVEVHIKEGMLWPHQCSSGR